MTDLPVRLDTIFHEVCNARGDLGPGRVLDVGSDHGLLSLKCLEEDMATNVICTDIRPDPASKSKLLLEQSGYKTRSEVKVTDGLNGVSVRAGDVIVIAGMGGLNIIDILTRAMGGLAEDIKSNIELILQPQKSTDLVRRYLADNGFEFLDETVCKDRDIFYNVLRLRFTGQSYSLELRQVYYGPKNLERKGKDSLTDEYLEHLTEVFTVRSRGNDEIRAMLQGG
ncbi:MAG: class I SAM-dependent methyltransferase [Saccharofermentans sp.]|nr:class I SAM-dependent methyltransferase [Saccharofermentans sp.]